MITYIILLLITLCIAYLAYITFDKEYLSPTFISSIMFSGGITCSIIGLLSWNRIKIVGIEAFLIIPIGLLSFFVGELIARNEKKKTNENEIKNSGLSNLKNIITSYRQKDSVDIFIIVSGFIFVLLTTVILFVEIREICAYYGFISNSISETLAFYRTKTDLFTTNTISVNFIVKQLKKVCDVINIIFAYLLIKKAINKDLKKNIIETMALVATIIMALLQTFLNSGGRSILMHFLVAYVALYILLLIKKKGKQSISKKSIGAILIVGIVILVLFYTILPLLGRSVESNFIEYITFYLGSPIPALTVFAHDTAKLNPHIGSETFSSFYSVLNRLKVTNYAKPLTYEWINFIPGLSSNVYTSFRAYYHDFSFIGVAILQFIFGYFYTKFYLKARNSNKAFYKILYAYYFYVLIDQIRAEQFFGLINTSTIAILVIFIVLYRIILCDKNEKEIRYVEKIKGENQTK